MALGYSLGQLATKVNKTASSIRGWEKGDAFPDEDEVGALADALDLDEALLIRLLPDSEVWQADPVLPVDVHDPWGESEDSSAEEESPESDQAVDSPEDTARSANQAAVDSESADDDDELAQDDEPGAASSDDAETISDEPSGTESTESTRASEPSQPQATGASLHEAMTEAVPVVPRAAVAVADPPRPSVFPAPTAEQTRINSNPVLAAWDEIVRLYHRVFDPSRPWIYRVRFVLLLVAFYIMLRVLAWAGSNLLDAIGEVLDSFSFSPTETPDVQN